MGKCIWVLNHYAGDSFFDKGGRHYWITKNLVKLGYDPVVFCCNVKHNPGTEKWFESEKLWERHMATEISTPYVFIKSSKYIGNGLKRIINMFCFYFNLKRTANQYVKKYGKPDIIFASSVHPLTLVAGIQLARKYGVRCISEIRDLWPESIVEYGIASEHNPFVIALRLMEKWIYVHSDALVFLGEGEYQSIIDNGWQKIVSKDKFVYINNGVDIDVFDYNKNTYTISDSDLDDKSLFPIVYTGSIRKVNDVSKILEVAQNVENTRVRFLIWGAGDQLEELKNRVVEEKIKNVVFKGWVDKKYIPYITSKAFFNYAHNQPSTLFRYGISFNKIFDYLAAGKPIICDFPCPYNPVLSGKAGVSVDSAEPSEIAATIDRLVEISNEEYEHYCSNARKTAEIFDFKNLTKRLVDVIERTE